MNVSCNLKLKNNTFFSPNLAVFIGKGELQQNALARFYQSMLLEYVTLENKSSMQEKPHELNTFFFFLNRLEDKMFCQIF